MANSTTVTDTPAPPAEGRTILLPVRAARGATTLVPILVRPGPRSPAQDDALARFWAGVLSRAES